MAARRRNNFGASPEPAAVNEKDRINIHHHPSRVRIDLCKTCGCAFRDGESRFRLTEMQGRHLQAILDAGSAAQGGGGGGGDGNTGPATATASASASAAKKPGAGVKPVAYKLQHVCPACYGIFSANGRLHAASLAFARAMGVRKAVLPGVVDGGRRVATAVAQAAAAGGAGARARRRQAKAAARDEEHARSLRTTTLPRDVPRRQYRLFFFFTELLDPTPALARLMRAQRARNERANDLGLGKGPRGKKRGGPGPGRGAGGAGAHVEYAALHAKQRLPVYAATRAGVAPGDASGGAWAVRSVRCHYVVATPRELKSFFKDKRIPISVVVEVGDDDDVEGDDGGNGGNGGGMGGLGLAATALAAKSGRPRAAKARGRRAKGKHGNGKRRTVTLHGALYLTKFITFRLGSDAQAKHDIMLHLTAASPAGARRGELSPYACTLAVGVGVVQDGAAAGRGFDAGLPFTRSDHVFWPDERWHDCRPVPDAWMEGVVGAATFVRPGGATAFAHTPNSKRAHVIGGGRKKVRKRRERRARERRNAARARAKEERVARSAVQAGPPPAGGKPRRARRKWGGVDGSPLVDGGGLAAGSGSAPLLARVGVLSATN